MPDANMRLKQETLLTQIKWLWSYIGKYKPLYIFGLFLTAITSALVIINPFLQEKLIDEVITPRNAEPLIGILVLMLCVTLARLGLRYLMVIIMEWVSTKSTTAIRANMFDVVQAQDFRFFRKLKAGNMMNRMTSDLDMMRHSVAWIVYQFVDAFALFGSSTIFLMFVNWKLALSLIAVTPIILLVSRRFVSRIRPRFVFLREKLTRLSTIVTENIDGNRVVKAFAREPYEQQIFEERNHAYRKTSVENAIISAKYNPILEAFSQILTVVTLVVGGIFMIQGELTAGQYMAFSSLTWTLSNPLRMLGMLLSDLQRFHVAANMIMEIVQSPISIKDKPEAPDMPPPADGHAYDIDYKNVRLDIDGQTILDDISFSVKAGETIGILGSTGSGKTSLVNMLLRFFEPTSGEVLLDGHNIGDYTLSSLRKKIGIAMQEVFLFSESVGGNIAYGRPDMPQTEIEKVAVQADADSFIQRMEEGYETLVGERGVGLSGGQKQRVALARALAIKPAILILDDTTSAVDSETETYIQEQLMSLDNHCTKIIIAQRITSFRGAKQILVMDGGKIIERGTHQELLAKKGFYHHIYQLQMGASQEGGQG
ncbi:MAG: ABC transporter ATP-binding protein/permease [Spirochaetaceae bacterium]|jgi:ATP-binding cassette subfamily B protein|nr:ABC transporter ATP-binding protein/permease [Spirochaetaceae bacterium]